MSATPALHLAGVYHRRVRASLTRIWENVFDWEHLAHLHDGSFARCVLLDRGDWGWRVALTTTGADRAQVIEMRADKPAGRYVSTTLEGAGTGSEIRVVLTPREAARTDVIVEFHLPESHPDRLEALGGGLARAYALLWDEDEAMMQAREAMLGRRIAARPDAAAVALGDERQVRATLPIAFDFGGAPFRLVELDGLLVAHAAVCPHWLGPLDAEPVIDGAVRCPWHGYRFDVATGRCRTHPELRLPPAPIIAVIDGQVVARTS